MNKVLSSEVNYVEIEPEGLVTPVKLPSRIITHINLEKPYTKKGISSQFIAVTTTISYDSDFLVNPKSAKPKTNIFLVDEEKRIVLNKSLKSKRGGKGIDNAIDTHSNTVLRALKKY